MFSNRTTGEKIRFYRQRKKISARELGEQVGVTAQAILQYERSEREPNKETINKIAIALDLNPMELMFDMHNTSPASREVGREDSFYKWLGLSNHKVSFDEALEIEQEVLKYVDFLFYKKSQGNG